MTSLAKNNNARLHLTDRRLLPVLAVLVVGLVGAGIVTVATHAASPVSTSWIGNTFGGGKGAEYIQQNVYNAFIGSDGTVFANTVWDEDGTEAGVYRDGRRIGRLTDTHWNDEIGGFAIGADSTYVYASAISGSGNAVERYRRSDYGGASFGGGIGHLSNARLVDGAPRGIASNGTEVFVAVPSKNLVHVYRASDMTELRTFGVPSPTRVAVDTSGRVWIATGGDVKAYSAAGASLSLAITDPVDPTSLAIDPQGRLVVGDDGEARQQVRVYSLSGTPTLVDTIGVAGGMFAAPRGATGPLRFNGIVGANFDAADKLYVVQDHPTSQTAGTGTNIDAYVKSGSTWSRSWQLLGLEFADTADIDNDYSRGVQAYTADERFTLDMSKPNGKQWTWSAITKDRFANPDDGRVVDNDHAFLAPQVITKDGHRVMIVTGMYPDRDGVLVDGFNGEIAVTRNKYAGSGTTWHLDDNANIWNSDGSVIKLYRLQGFDAAGMPNYPDAPSQTWARPSQLTSIERLRYDASRDALIISGFTPSRPVSSQNDEFNNLGSTVMRFDGWMNGGRTLRWQTALPYNGSENHRQRVVMKSMDIAGNRLFAVNLFRTSGFDTDGIGPQVLAYDIDTGALSDTWSPGTEIGSYSGLVDLPDGLTAKKLPTGETLVLQEDDAQAKVIMYRYGSATGTVAPTTTPAPTRSATPVSTPPVTPTPTVTGQPGVAKPDLMVTAAALDPADVTPGKAARFRVTVKNGGGGAVPVGTIIGASVGVVGETGFAWSDTNAAGLPAGASITLTTNGGSGAFVGGIWTARAGAMTLQANVDDVNRIAEVDETNNVLEIRLTVTEGGASPSPVVSAADINGDGRVNVLDLSALLSVWGKSGKSDLNGDGTTNVLDLSILLSRWGS